MIESACRGTTDLLIGIWMEIVKRGGMGEGEEIVGVGEDVGVLVWMVVV